MSNLTKNIIQVAAVFFLAALVVNASWAPPTMAPPDGNTPAPVNVGSVTQNKTGTLGLGALAVFGNSFLAGNVQIGSSTVPTTLKIVDGNQGAGKVLTSDSNGLASWQTFSGGSSGGGSGQFLSTEIIYKWNVNNKTEIFSYDVPSSAKFIFGRFDTMSGRPDLSYTAGIEARWLKADGTVLGGWAEMYVSQSGVYLSSFVLPTFGASKIQFRGSRVYGWEQLVHIWGYTQ